MRGGTRRTILMGGVVVALVTLLSLFILGPYLGMPAFVDMTPLMYVGLFVVSVVLIAFGVSIFSTGRTARSKLSRGFGRTFHGFPFSFVGVVLALAIFSGFSLSVVGMSASGASADDTVMTGVGAVIVIITAVVLLTVFMGGGRGR